ncbi:MAG TPA: glycosyltransferase family 4 protein [bacterium]
MKIGLVSGEYPPQQGGVGDFTRELAAALAALGHAAHVITAQPLTPNPSNLQSPISISLPPSVHRLTSQWTWRSLAQVRRLARDLSLDALNIQYQAAVYGMTPPIHFLPRVAGVPTVVTFHDLRLPYLFPKAGALRWRAVLALARGASAVIVTNAEDEARLTEAGGLKRLAHIPIGSNIAPALPPGFDRDDWRARLGAGRQDWLLGYFGFLNASKGGETLVRALAQLAGQGRPARLALIGGRSGASDPTDVGYGAQVDALARDLGVDARIQRTGFVPPPEVSACLAACDLVVLPYGDGASFRRGSLMAALAHGCAIVSTTPATAQPGLRDGENIRLVPPGDPAACALAVAELMAAPEARARLGEGARAVSAEFGWEQIAARTAAVIESVL